MMNSTLTSRLEELVQRLKAWRTSAEMWRDIAAAGQLNSLQARTIREQAQQALALLSRIPRTQGTAEKVTTEWQYAGDIAADIVAVETELTDIGNWLAARAGQMWTGYDIATAYPWDETIPVFSATQTAGLQTELNQLITALDTFIANISI